MQNENLKQVKARQQQKHDVELNWIQAGNKNFTPKPGEIIVYDPDSTDAANSINEDSMPARVKIGDGVTNVNDLPYINTVILVHTWEEGDV